MKIVSFAANGCLTLEATAKPWPPIHQSNPHHRIMKIISKSILAALAVTLLSSGAVFADDVVRRIDHPNGPATYVTAPAEDRAFASTERRGATIGVYAGNRSFGGRDEAGRSEIGLTDAQGRTLVPIHQGRGQTLYTPVQR
jgi:hypothetical protein